MTRPVTFSICIPNYNYARYLRLTIRSVLDQSYPHFEIIVADNASTDDSVDVAQSFGDSRIKLIRNPTNLGFAPNLDRATETATGDYIILLSSDDLMGPGALERYAGLIAKHGNTGRELVLSSDVNVIDQDGRTTGSLRNVGPGDTVLNTGITKRPVAREGDVTLFNGLDLLDAALHGSLTNIGKFLSTCYSGTLYRQAGGYHSIMSVIPDAQLSHKLMLSNPLVIFVKEPLFSYRVHGSNHYSSIGQNVKLLCDKYVLTQMYGNDMLKPLGLTQRLLQQRFVDYTCLRQPFYKLLTAGGWLAALRYYAFGIATYPGLMVRRPLFWLLPFGFLFYPALHVIYSIYKAFRRPSAS